MFPIRSHDELFLPHTVGFLQGRGSVLSFWKAVSDLRDQKGVVNVGFPQKLSWSSHLSPLDYLCSPEENIYKIDFIRFKIRDMDTGTVLFEIKKPPASGELPGGPWAERWVRAVRWAAQGLLRLQRGQSTAGTWTPSFPGVICQGPLLFFPLCSGIGLFGIVLSLLSLPACPLQAFLGTAGLCVSFGKLS